MKSTIGYILLATTMIGVVLAALLAQQSNLSSSLNSVQTSLNNQLSALTLDIDSAPHISIASGLKVCQFEAKYETHSNDYYDYQIASFDALNGNGCTETELYDSLSALNLEPTSSITFTASGLATTTQDMAIKGLITENPTCTESIPAGSSYFQIPRVIFDVNRTQHPEAIVYAKVQFHAASDGTTHQHSVNYETDNNGKDVEVLIHMSHNPLKINKDEWISYWIELNGSKITYLSGYNDDAYNAPYKAYPGNLCIYWQN